MVGSTPWDTAKYGAYTMFCSTILKVVHFELLQVSNIFSCLICMRLYVALSYNLCNSISAPHISMWLAT